jgi:hypothetical protein
MNIVYDDSYGVVTESDLIASTELAFLAYDREEQEHAILTAEVESRSP